MCRHIYDWNIVDCDVKQLIHSLTPRGVRFKVLLCLLPGVLWLWHLYSVGPHPVSSLHIYTFVVSQTFMAGAARQAGDADPSWAPGLTSGLQRSVNVHRGAQLLVPQWLHKFFCIVHLKSYFNLIALLGASISSVLSASRDDHLSEAKKMLSNCFGLKNPHIVCVVSFPLEQGSSFAFS